MSRLAHFIGLPGLPPATQAQTTGLGPNLESFFEDTLRVLTTDLHNTLLPVVIVALVVGLAVIAVVWLRRIRRSKGPQLHRSAWPARASRNQPNDTPLVATRTFRQRRRRRRRSRQPQ